MLGNLRESVQTLNGWLGVNDNPVGLLQKEGLELSLLHDSFVTRNAEHSDEKAAHIVHSEERKIVRKVSHVFRRSRVLGFGICVVLVIVDDYLEHKDARVNDKESPPILK